MKADLGNTLGMLLGGVVLLIVLNQIANNPKVSPLWRKVATTAEGDVYQHIISGAIVTILG